MSDARHFPSAGYRGTLQIGGSVWPYSSSTLAEKVDLITPQVNGFAGQIGIVEGSKTREGTVTVPILGLAGLDQILGYFESESARTTMRQIIMDNTFNRMTFQGFLRSITLSCDPGSGLTAEIGMMGGIVDESTGTKPVDYALSNDLGDHQTWSAAPLDSSWYGKAQIPFHKTKVTATKDVNGVDSATVGLAPGGSYWKDVSGWSITIDNNTAGTLVTASGAFDEQGFRLHQGQQTGQGQLTLINPFVDATGMNRPDWGNLVITIYEGADSRSITLYRVINHTYGPPLPEPNARMTQTIQFAITTGSSATLDHILFTKA